ncbi:hypothetical protein SAMN03159423_3756 [Bradyrhizobium sp. NFR13]|nr:hypothetical protein SAMN03159423_3756 [Bradyrhizobium sp. NFR13]
MRRCCAVAERDAQIHLHRLRLTCRGGFGNRLVIFDDGKDVAKGLAVASHTVLLCSPARLLQRNDARPPSGRAEAAIC